MAPIKRALGNNTGLFLNPVGLGCMGMTEFYGNEFNDETNMTVLDRALELGCTFWDTADMYGAGENEELLGRYFAKTGNRDKVFLCTKFGVLRDRETKQFTGLSGKPDYVHKACNASLERLGVDTIDLFYLHRPDPEIPIEDTVKAMAELVKDGKVRYLGLSAVTPELLRRAHKVHPIAAIQVQYSPWFLDIEKNGLLETAKELGVTVVAYSPLGMGFLTGDIKSRDELVETDFRRKNPNLWSDDGIPKNLDLVNKIERLAEKKGVFPAELVLAWVLAQGKNIFAIPGTKKIKYLEQNVQSGQIHLTNEELTEMRKLVDAVSFSK
ncbi:aldo-keto reductase [Phascolomyces articulosus]|uniref:Aldo-keto reductase n=1 Tax=Phascolomyces articulosus TaxID=60185 RepID=A0AAD5PKS0_9FUNG|nr:aldo-keto reductase [Phascolomyces articulosus]